jgi:hypothetical protein
MHGKNAQVLKSTAVGKRGQRHEPAAPPHLCGKCGFQGLDAYDITLHLCNNRQCFIITNDPITVPNAASITRVESTPPEEGDSDMYKDYDAGSSS